MKRTKDKQLQTYKHLTVALAILAAGLLGGLVFCATNTKSPEEKEYLALLPHLMRRFPVLKCDSSTLNLYTNPEEWPEEVKNKNYVCEMTNYGISEDNDPYVSYTQHIYDPTTHEEVDQKQYTLYFQHQDDNEHRYSEAVADEN